MDEWLGLLVRWPDRQIELLACLAHELTVRARGSYPARGEEWTQLEAQCLRACNEVLHRITAQIRAMASHDGTQMSPEELGRVLREHAEIGGIRSDLEKAANRAGKSTKPPEAGSPRS